MVSPSDTKNNTETDKDSDSSSADISDPEPQPMSTSTPDSANNSLARNRTRRSLAGIQRSCFCCNAPLRPFTRIQGRRPIHSTVETPSTNTSRSVLIGSTVHSIGLVISTIGLTEPKTPERASAKKTILFGLETLKKVLGPVTRRRSLRKRKASDDDEDVKQETLQPSTGQLEKSPVKRRCGGLQSAAASPTLRPCGLQSAEASPSLSAVTNTMNTSIKVEPNDLSNHLSNSSLNREEPLANSVNMSNWLTSIPVEFKGEITLKVEREVSSITSVKVGESNQAMNTRSIENISLTNSVNISNSMASMSLEIHSDAKRESAVEAESQREQFQAAQDEVLNFNIDTISGSQEAESQTDNEQFQAAQAEVLNLNIDSISGSQEDQVLGTDSSDAQLVKKKSHCILM